VRDVAEDLGYAHDGDVFGADDLLLMLPGHLGAAEAGEGGVWDADTESGNELRAVGVAGGFAGREENARIGETCGDASSLSSFAAWDEVVQLTWSARWLCVR
jgi:hypothetical protein